MIIGLAVGIPLGVLGLVAVVVVVIYFIRLPKRKR